MKVPEPAESPALHHPALGAVPHDPGPGAALRRPAAPRRRQARPAHPAADHDLPADAARGAGLARGLSGRVRRPGAAVAAHPCARRSGRRGGADLRRGGCGRRGRRPRRAGDRRAAPQARADAADPRLEPTFLRQSATEAEIESVRWVKQSRPGLEPCRRSRPADGLRRDRGGRFLRLSTRWCRRISPPIGRQRSSSSRSSPSIGRNISPTTVSCRR